MPCKSGEEGQDCACAQSAVMSHRTRVTCDQGGSLDQLRTVTHRVTFPLTPYTCNCDVDEGLRTGDALVIVGEALCDRTIMGTNDRV